MTQCLNSLENATPLQTMTKLSMILIDLCNKYNIEIEHARTYEFEDMKYLSEQFNMILKPNPRINLIDLQFSFITKRSDAFLWILIETERTEHGIVIDNRLLDFIHPGITIYTKHEKNYSISSENAKLYYLAAGEEIPIDLFKVC